MRTALTALGAVIANFVVIVAAGWLLMTYYYAPQVRQGLPIDTLSPLQVWFIKGPVDLFAGAAVGLIVGRFQKWKPGLLAPMCLVPSFLIELQTIGFTWTCGCVLRSILSPSLHQVLQALIAIAVATRIANVRSKRLNLVTIEKATA
jgi:hypothetical protein